MKKAKNLISERHPRYLECADTVIQTAGKETAMIADEIIHLLKLSDK
jgi:shikimate kinase